MNVSNDYLQRIAVAITFLMLTSSAMGVAQLQRPADAHELRIGMMAGTNWNYVTAAADEFIETPAGSSLHSNDFIGPHAFGPFLGVLADYDISELIGLHARLTYDDRRVSGTRNDARLDTRLSYLTLEPALRVTNSTSNRIFLMAGPSVHWNVGHSYDYTPSRTAEEGEPAIIDGTIEHVRKPAFGIWVSSGVDIPTSLDTRGSGWYVSPFFEASYIFGQIDYRADKDRASYTGPESEAAPPSYDDGWFTVTFRIGVAAKFSFGAE